jgi:hypothetical protein
VAAAEQIEHAVLRGGDAELRGLGQEHRDRDLVCAAQHEAGPAVDFDGGGSDVAGIDIVGHDRL